MAEPYPSRVIRGPVATFVIYGNSRDHAYTLRPNDVQQVEERVGKTFEYTSESELYAALTALSIPIQRIADADWAYLSEAVAVTPLQSRPPDTAQVPEPPPSSSQMSRSPWGILVPIIAGGLVLLLLVLLLRSCGSDGAPIPEVTLTPSPTAELTPTVPGGPTVTARVNAPVHAGPGDPYPVIGALLAGQSVEALGISPDGRWYAIRFFAAPDRQGWVNVDRVSAQNTESLPTLQPPTLPTETPVPSPTVTATVTPSPTPMQAPVAVINGPATGEAGQRLRFDARRSTVAPGASLTAFDWNFGDGGTSSGIEVDHIYNVPGIYTVLLRVADSNGLRGEAVQRVEIRAAPVTPTPLPPRAVIGAPLVADVTQPVIFDGRESTAPSPIVQYRWTFGDGGTEEGARVSHTYVTPGIFNVTLVIIDEAGRESIAATQIEVRGAAPTPTATPVPIAGSGWALASYSGGAGGMIPALAGVTVTAAFGRGGDLTGFGGCNNYNATYRVAGEAITILPPVATGTLCVEPPGVMEQEQTYFGLLPQAANYRLSSERLELTGNDGRTLLQFIPLIQPR